MAPLVELLGQLVKHHESMPELAQFQSQVVQNDFPNAIDLGPLTKVILCIVRL
jgi:hypothetical protein